MGLVVVSSSTKYRLYCDIAYLINLTKLSNGLPLKKLCSRLTRGVSHCDLAIHIKKYVKAKEEFLKLKYFIMQKI
jgi:hypothetical protein